MFQFNTKLQSQAGVTFIELIITVAITLIGLLGIGVALYTFQKTHHSSVTVETGITALNALNSAMLNSDTYLTPLTSPTYPTVAAALNSADPNVVIPNFTVNLNLGANAVILPVTVVQGTADNPANPTIVSLPANAPTTYFDDNGNLCSATGKNGFGTTGNLKCSHAIQVALFRRATNDWAIAKRVISSNGESPIIMRDKIKTLNTPIPAVNSVAIPTQIYNQGFTYVCDSTHYGMAGITTSGGVACVGERPTTPVNPYPCAAGQLPLGVKFSDTTNPTSGTLIPVCSTYSPTVSCPLGYRMQSFRGSMLYPGPVPGSPAASACVLDAAPTTTISITSSATQIISGRVCPQGYNLTAYNCALFGTPSSTSGLCTNQYSYSWASAPGSNETLVWTQKILSTSNTYTVNAVPGFAYGTMNAPADVLCEAVIPPQACGATWKSAVILTGTCTSNAVQPVAATVNQ